MTEQEYIVATNLAKIRAAKAILSDVTEGHDFKTPPGRYREVLQGLAYLENNIHAGLELIE